MHAAAVDRRAARVTRLCCCSRAALAAIGIGRIATFAAMAAGRRVPRERIAAPNQIELAACRDEDAAGCRSAGTAALVEVLRRRCVAAFPADRGVACNRRMAERQCAVIGDGAPARATRRRADCGVGLILPDESAVRDRKPIECGVHALRDGEIGEAAARAAARHGHGRATVNRHVLADRQRRGERDAGHARREIDDVASLRLAELVAQRAESTGIVAAVCNRIRRHVSLPRSCDDGLDLCR